MSEVDPAELAVVACEAASAGGERLLAMRSGFQVSQKGPRDFVTDADLASQQAVYEVIQSRYPNHSFVGEEDSQEKRSVPGDSVCWVVDPLDGTTNYLHQYPFYAVSIAAVKGDALLAAAIFDPLRSHMYWSAAGQGAWLNEEQLHVSQTQALEEALISMSLPPQVQRHSPDLLGFLNVVGTCRAIRRTGSAALNLAQIAAGQIDGYWAHQINAWDVAAGVLLIREAGGVVTNSIGGPFDLWKADLVAGNCNQVHRELLDQLSSSSC